jgi:hypothetical protein
MGCYKTFYSSIRLGARAPRGAVVTADLKNNNKNNSIHAWIS